MWQPKYRIWDKVKKIMIYPGDGTNFIYPDGNVAMLNDDNTLTISSGDVVTMYYAGYRDRNKINIFDGDILQHPRGDKVVIKHEPALGIFRSVYSDGDSRWLEHIISGPGAAVVVGNIYQNPELCIW